MPVQFQHEKPTGKARPHMNSLFNKNRRLFSVLVPVLAAGLLLAAPDLRAETVSAAENAAKAPAENPAAKPEEQNTADPAKTASGNQGGITEYQDLYQEHAPNKDLKNEPPHPEPPLTDSKSAAAPVNSAASEDPSNLLFGGKSLQSNDGGSDFSDQNRGGASLLEFTMSCFLVIGLIFALSWLLKKTRLVPNSRGSRLKLISVLPTGPKTKLLLVQVGDEEILVGSTPTSLNMVYKLPGKAPQQSSESSLADKASLFRSILDRKSEKPDNGNAAASEADPAPEQEPEGSSREPAEKHPS